MNDRQPLIMILAGGTGGHVYPALAVAGELRRRGYRVAWMGTRRGLEARVVPGAGIHLHFLQVRGVRGKQLAARVFAAFALLVSMFQAMWIMLRESPACVLGLGGYVAGPGGVAAWLCRKPLLLHEQNAVAGTANRLLYPLASHVMAGFVDAFGPRRGCEVVGNPVRPEILALAAEPVRGCTGDEPLRLLVLGGSLGARAVNQAVAGAWKLFQERAGGNEISIWHQCGPALADEVLADYGDLPDDDSVRVSPFIDDMAGAYRWCDLVLCRAGAITVAEITVAGRAAILVPLPHAIDDHQTRNARALTDQGGGLLLPQHELEPEGLVKLLRELRADPDSLRRMGENARALARTDATGIICDRCREAISGDG